MSCTDLLLVIVAVFFPPIPVAIRRGVCSADFFINVALCCLGFLPGLIHAFYIISKYPGDEHGCRHGGYAPVNGSEQTFYGSSDLERAGPSSSHQQQPQHQAPPSGEYYTSLDNKKDNTNRPPPYSG